MSTALHLFRKDVRRHALWLVVWLVVCVSPLAVLALPDGAMVGRVAINMASPAIRLVLFLVLVQMVVHEDPLVDSTAFWLTRPIGGRALLAGKVLFVFLLLVLPVMAADVALVAATGLASRHLWLAVPEIALEWTLWASGMFMLAALTSTFRGLLGAALRIALLWFGMDLFLLLVLPYLLHRELYYPRVTLAVWFGLMGDAGGFERVPTLVASRTIGVSILQAVAAGATAVLLFLTRRTRLAWATICVAVVGVFGISLQWRWDFLGDAARALPQAVSAPDGIDQRVQLSIESIERTSSSAEEAAGKSTNERMVYGRVAITGLDEPLAAGIQGLSGKLTFPDGTGFVVGGTGEGFTGIWSPSAVEALLGGARFVNLEQENALATLIVKLPVAEYRRHQGEDGRLDVTAVLMVGRYRVAAELPLRPGARYDDGIVRAVITSVGSQDGNCAVLFRETQISLLLAPRPSVHRRMLFFRFNPNVLYVLRNRRRGEAFWPQNGTTAGFGWPSRTRIDEAVIMSMYRSNVGAGPPLPRVDAAWLADADLLRIESDPVGTVARHVVESAFTIPVVDGEHPS